MKRISIVILFFVLVLTGCDGSFESRNQKSPAIESQNPKTVESGTGNTESKKDYTVVSRKPDAADWSFMKRKVISLENEGQYPDFRQADLTALDLLKEIEKLKCLSFDTYTKWPDNLPAGFDPKAVMEIGRNPGLGIRSLHEKGITGKGVNIAIIDTTLLLEHEEYCNQIKLYNEINAWGMTEMHGAFVASLSVGKSSGAAPNAGLYYIGCNNFNGDYTNIDFTHIANAIDRVLELNKDLPKEGKIRAISISSNTCPEHKGYAEYTEAIEKAKKENIFVITCNLFDTYGYWTYGLDKEFLTDPDNPDSYKPHEWNLWLRMVSHMAGVEAYYEKKINEDFKGEMLLIPIGSRTYANPTGTDQYSFSRLCGWSAIEPYLTGVYAMACQVKPDITPEIFWEAALKTGYAREVTGDSKKYAAKILNPEKLMESLSK